MNKQPQNPETTTQSEQDANGPTLKRGHFDFPVYVRWYGESDDDVGSSSLSVIYDALVAYKKVVAGWPNMDETKLTMVTIDEVIAELTYYTFRQLAKYSETFDPDYLNNKQSK